MSKKKNKFDLTNLVHDGLVKEGDTLFFVSDPKLTCVVKKVHGHECKVEYKGEVITIEPGAYFEGRFGMRVESMVYVG
mgnify:CR=1 FL=1